MAQVAAQKKLSLVEKCIASIDPLQNPLRSSLDTLYLSNNELRTLENLEQFTALTKLSLGFNNIAALSELTHLPPTLESLTLEGNPVAAAVNYRAHLISLLPRLRSLDGVPVTPAEIALSDLAVRKESSLLKLVAKAELDLEACGELRRDAEKHVQTTFEAKRQAVEAGQGPEIFEERARTRVDALLRKKRFGKDGWERTYSEALLEAKGGVARERTAIDEILRASSSALPPRSARSPASSRGNSAGGCEGRKLPPQRRQVRWDKSVLPARETAVTPSARVGRSRIEIRIEEEECPDPRLLIHRRESQTDPETTMLRTRLREEVRRNQENVQKARREIAELSARAQITADNNRNLSEQLRHVNHTICEALPMRSMIGLTGTTAVPAGQKKQPRYKTADFRLYSLTKFGLRSLLAATRTEHRIRQCLAPKLRAMARKAFHELRRMQQIFAFRRRCSREQDTQTVRRILLGWSRARSAGKAAAEFASRVTFRKFVIGLRLYGFRRRGQLARLEKAAAVVTARVKRRCMRGLVRICAQQRLGAVENVRKARLQHIARLRAGVWLRLRRYVYGRISKRKGQILAFRRFIQATLQKCFYGMHALTGKSRLISTAIRGKHQVLQISRCLHLWIKQQKASRARNCHDLRLLRILFAAWAAHLANEKSTQIAARSIQERCRKTTARSVLMRWQSTALKRRGAAKIFQLFHEHSVNESLRLVWRNWRTQSVSAVKPSDRKDTISPADTIKRRFFGSWLELHRSRGRARFLRHVSDLFRRPHADPLKTIPENTLASWGILAHRNARLRSALCRLFTRRRQKSALLALFSESVRTRLRKSLEHREDALAQSAASARLDADVREREQYAEELGRIIRAEREKLEIESPSATEVGLQLRNLTGEIGRLQERRRVLQGLADEKCKQVGKARQELEGTICAQKSQDLRHMKAILAEKKRGERLRNALSELKVEPRNEARPRLHLTQPAEKEFATAYTTAPATTKSRKENEAPGLYRTSRRLSAVGEKAKSDVKSRLQRAMQALQPKYVV